MAVLVDHFFCFGKAQILKNLAFDLPLGTDGVSN